MGFFVRRLVTVLLALVVVANAAFLAGILVTREGPPRPLTADRIAAASRPAIVLIQANYKISTSIPVPAISDAKVQLLVQQVTDQIRAGRVAATRAAAEKAAVEMVVANPSAYYEPGAADKSDYNLVGSGTGFFVSEDGYLVTAAHVVSADPTEIRATVISLSNKPQALAEARQQLAKGFTRASGLSLTDSQLDKMMDFETAWLAKYMTIGQVDVRYFLGTGEVEAGDRLVSTGARATVVNIDSTSKGHDIAIMKAEVHGAPTLTVAGAAPEMGKAAYAIGYPHRGYLQEEAPTNTIIKPTLTSGKVKSTETREGGWSAYGTDAQLTHGDSGGPVIDSNGQVIGVVSYSKVDSQGNQVDGGGFFLPAKFIKANLADYMVKGSGPSSITSIYYQALAEGDSQRYKEELVLLDQVQSRLAWGVFVKDDITNVQSRILSGNDKTPPALAQYAPASAASAPIAVLIALLAWVAIRLPGRRTPSISDAGLSQGSEPVQAPSEY
jgi:S1-C subfamily serine protease